MSVKTAVGGATLGGVGVVAASGSTLPFTGAPLWIFALVALALLVTGFALRRLGREA